MSVTDDPIVLHIGMPKTATKTWQNHILPMIAKDRYLGIPYAHPLVKKAVHNLTTSNGFHYSQNDVERAFSEAFSALKLDQTGSAGPPILSRETFAGPSPPGDWPFVDRGLVSDRLKQLFPNAKIVLFLRSQPDLIASMYGQSLTQRQSRFTRFLSPEDWLDYCRTYPANGFLRGLEFDRVWQRYADLFGRNSILVETFELFCQSPADSIARVAEFSGFRVPDKEAMIDVPSYNTSPYTDRWMLYRTVARYFGIAAVVDKLVSPARQRRFFESGRKRKVRWGEEANAFFVDTYGQSNASLASAISLDLQGQGYPFA